MITVEQAERTAVTELEKHGITGPVSHRELDGGWRFWVSTPPNVIGNMHVLIAADSGRARLIPVGLPDHVARQFLLQK